VLILIRVDESSSALALALAGGVSVRRCPFDALLAPRSSLAPLRLAIFALVWCSCLPGFAPLATSLPVVGKKQRSLTYFFAVEKFEAMLHMTS
jgi:hypothetical protein